MYRADYHMHTSMSPDSTASMASQIETAISKGFDEIALTDHFEFDLMEGEWKLTMDLDQYRAEIKKYQLQYKDQIRIRLGIEIGYENRYKTAINELIAGKLFDFIICSTHKCEMQEIAFGGFYEGKAQKEAYSKYFEHVWDAVNQFEQFNVYGHLDYVNRYGDYAVKVLDPKDYEEQIDAILKKLIEKGKGLEVNTSGIRYGLGHFNPQIPVLCKYRELGGEIITIGSDSHVNDHVGFLWDEAARMLKNIGFKAYATFEAGKPILKDL